MNILIVEDEQRAANRIERLLNDIDPNHRILAKLESVKEGIDWLKSNQADLIISDIQLADGMSFEIYETIHPNCPIIFTTAYDHYAIEAFETNGIDYLLKPVEQERLEKALNKLAAFQPKLDIGQLINLSQQTRKEYKTRFMVKVGDKIKSIPVQEITAFYSMDKGTFLHTNSHRNYVLDFTMDAVQEMMDPTIFFRISRKYLVRIDAITEVIAHSNSRLKIKINGFDGGDMIVARERVKDFKQWLDQ